MLGSRRRFDVNGLLMVMSVGMTAADLAQRRSHEECHKAILEFSSAASTAQHSSAEHAAAAVETPGNFCVQNLNAPLLPGTIVIRVKLLF